VGGDSVNELQIFENADFGKIRMVEIDGKPYAVGVDVARALEYASPSKAVIDHCKGITKLGIPSKGGVQETNVIPEGDIIRLITKAADQSKNENIRAKAEKFEAWIFDEVIPQVLRTGQYKAPATPEEQMAQGLLAAQKILAEKDKQIEEMKPKAIFADAVSASKTSILVGDLAKLIRQNGVDVGQKRLFGWLREHGWLMKGGASKNMPTQRGMEMGLFEVKEGSYVNGEGVNVTTKTTKVTGKGQVYFVNKFLNKEAG
jgi:anti-repressor protein